MVATHPSTGLEADDEDEAELAAEGGHLGVVRVTRGCVDHLLAEITGPHIVTHLDRGTSGTRTEDEMYLRDPRQ